jgi:hypothetical protein
MALLHGYGSELGVLELFEQSGRNVESGGHRDQASPLSAAS